MKFAFTLASMFLGFVSLANSMDSLRAEQREEGMFVVHQVEEEETIYSIARRYGGSVHGIVKHNQIVDNRIEIGQVIYVLIESENPVQAVVVEKPSSSDGIHIVELGETLYSISRKHDVKLKDLRRWNNLPDNNISPGMQLKLSKDAEPDTRKDEVKKETSPTVIEEVEEDSVDVESDPYADFGKYLVQTGETLSTIAHKIGVSIDSLKVWNNMRSDYLKIGQQLFFKESKEGDTSSINAPKEKVRTQIDEKGFRRVYEEGVASVIQTMNTSRYLALHRTLPIGTNLEVRNLMNNQVVHVKVVGKLPNTGLNKNLLLRLSQPAYDQLGILDSKSRVEVSYNQQ
ncbi:LysM repeat-containing protein [Ekhidna lutea]|uniref:LysM repeat-containing protein n=1 Tax=Ekhidna lutea TaxID=447679 RepID=A0A239M6T9_EKHLU|nr:LysM peptidoglycan-binding domain-containing protein [Ekhidna lutea]SNT37858.1 LysM repeat-containing protein [Ekhidna lutea]